MTHGDLARMAQIRRQENPGEEKSSCKEESSREEESPRQKSPREEAREEGSRQAEEIAHPECGSASLPHSARDSEREAEARVDEAAVHAERGMARVREDAEVALRGAGEILVRHLVEEVLRADGEGVIAPAVRDLGIGEPGRAVHLIVDRQDREAAEVAVAALAQGRIPVAGAPAL